MLVSALILARSVCLEWSMKAFKSNLTCPLTLTSTLYIYTNFMQVVPPSVSLSLSLSLSLSFPASQHPKASMRSGDLQRGSLFSWTVRMCMGSVNWKFTVLACCFPGTWYPQ
eukprot:TRINITY_DN2949_c1_g2_i1.p1 TRINITY_DN2949_c1_g2~~TRINITY_DN2949_c1_g2_i1.p1  ORF type:complete len:112 (+),score=6.92 TRINITY_DN2949_c1_g2_i1:95-430(+)